MTLRPLLVVAVAALLSSCAGLPAGGGMGGDFARVTAPTVGATVSSPFRVQGSAPGDWYFEAQFDAQLLDGTGRVLDEAPARAQSDWMTDGSVPFIVDFAYSSSTVQPATVVLTEDQTGENQGPPRTVRISILLSPS